MDRSSGAEADVAELYAASYVRLVGVVTLVAQSRAEAEECVQEAFVRVLGRWPQVSRLDSPEVWVRTVAFLLALNRRRNARNALRALWRHGPPAAAAAPTSDGVDIAAALRTLPVQQRQVVVMYHLLELEIGEIA